MLLLSLIFVTACNGKNEEEQNVVLERIDQEIKETMTTTFKIESETSFSEGIAFVEMIDTNDNRKIVAINPAGEILFEFDEWSSFDRISEFKGGIFVFDNKVYNNKGQVIASPELTGYDLIYDYYSDNNLSSHRANKSGYVIVKKLEESYKGDTRLCGVLNSQGQWEVPLSESGQWENEEILYTWENGEVNEDAWYYYSGDYQIPSYDYRNYEFAIFKQRFGESSIFLNDFGADYMLDGAFIGRKFIWDQADERFLPQEYMLYDFDGNALYSMAEFEGTIKDIHGGPYYNNGYLLFEMHNGTSSYYLVMIGPEGEFVFDPFKIDGGFEPYSDFNEKGFIFERDSIYHLYGYDGNITAYDDDILVLCEFSEGLALTEWLDGKFRYIDYEGNVVIEEITKTSGNIEVLNNVETEKEVSENQDTIVQNQEIESTGTNINLNNYVGTWSDSYSQRCWMDISIDQNDIYTIEINWSGSSEENYRWELIGTFDQKQNGIAYSGDMIYEFYGNDGSISKEYIYNDGKGLIYISSDGNLYWNDWKENAGADCVFMK